MQLGTILGLTLFLGTFLQVGGAQVTQLINLRFKHNLFGVEVAHLDNEVGQLFPDAPAGMVIFVYDPPTGYQATQKYPQGWSTPRMRIGPRQGAVAVLPSDPAGRVLTYRKSVSGVAGVARIEVFTGRNLVPASALVDFYGGSTITPSEGDTIMALVNGESFFENRFENGAWSSPLRLDPNAAVWYEARSGRQLPPDAPLVRPFFYFNNYALAWGIEHPFSNPDGCLDLGWMRLLRVRDDGTVATMGESIEIGGSFGAGWADASQNMVRLLPSSLPQKLMLAVSSGADEYRTGPFTIAPNTSYLPTPLPAELFQTIGFQRQPAGSVAVVAAPATLGAIFNYLTIGGTNRSMSEMWNCTLGANGGQPVSYQWQRKVGTGEWIDVSGAISSELPFFAVSESDYGMYRLEVKTHTGTRHSREAMLRSPLLNQIGNINMDAGEEVTIPLTFLAPDGSVKVTVLPATNAALFSSLEAEGTGTNWVLRLRASAFGSGTGSITIRMTDDHVEQVIDVGVQVQPQLVEFTQTLVFGPAFQFFAVEVVVGENRIDEILPDAPEGMLVFTFHPLTGYRASQRLPAGWSDPTLKLSPRGAAGAKLPAGSAPYSRTLTGFAERSLPLLYAGFNMIPASLLTNTFGGPTIRPSEGDAFYWQIPAGRVAVNAFENGQWERTLSFLPNEGIWYRSTTGLPVPAGLPGPGAFVYFNNHAPALHGSRPFLDQKGCITDGTAQLLLRDNRGGTQVIGDPVSIGQSANAGFINSSADLIRLLPYSPTPVSLQVEVARGETVIRTAPQPVEEGIFLGPIIIAGELYETVGFVAQPQSMHVPIGDSASMRSIFNFLYADGRDVSESLRSYPACSADGELEQALSYRWQKQEHPSGPWTDIPGAMNDVLAFDSVQLEDRYPTYRLRVRGEYDWHSSEARLLPELLSSVPDQKVAGGQSLTVPLRVHSSSFDPVSLSAWAADTNLAHNILVINSEEGSSLIIQTVPFSSGETIISVKARRGVLEQLVHFKLRVAAPIFANRLLDLAAKETSVLSIEIQPVESAEATGNPHQTEPLIQVYSPETPVSELAIRLFELPEKASAAVVREGGKTWLRVQLPAAPPERLFFRVAISNEVSVATTDVYVMLNPLAGAKPVISSIADLEVRGPRLEQLAVEFSDGDTPLEKLRAWLESDLPGRGNVTESNIEIVYQAGSRTTFLVFVTLAIDPKPCLTEVLTLNVADETQTAERSFRIIPLGGGMEPQTIDFGGTHGPYEIGFQGHLEASASSGGPVGFRIVSGPGRIAPHPFFGPNGLYFDAYGEVIVEAFQDGSDVYRCATARAKYVVGRIVSPPGNDSFSNRIALDRFAREHPGDTVGATREGGEPVLAPNATGASVWFSWVASEDGLLDVDAFSPQLSLVTAVFVGSSVEELRPAPAFLGVPPRVPVSAGREYQIAVDGKDGKTGSFMLTLAHEPQNISGLFHLTASRTPNGVLLKWNPLLEGSHALQETESLAGPWRDVPEPLDSGGSRIVAPGRQRFYRVVTIGGGSPVP